MSKQIKKLVGNVGGVQRLLQQSCVSCNNIINEQGVIIGNYSRPTNFWSRSSLCRSQINQFQRYQFNGQMRFLRSFRTHSIMLQTLSESELDDAQNESTYVQDEQDEQALPTPRDACVSKEQIELWAEQFKCDLSGRVGIKWLVYDRETGVVMGPNGVDARAMGNKHNVRLYVSQQGDYYPGVRKRVAGIVGNGEGVFNALAELLPALQKHQEKSSQFAKKSEEEEEEKESSSFLFQPGEISLSTIFPEEVLKMMRGMSALRKDYVDRECDIAFYTEKSQDRMPAVITYKVNLIGYPANVLKALILLVGYCQNTVSEPYRKFVNQSIHRYTETTWFGLLNRSFPKDSSLTAGKYKVEFITQTQILDSIGNQNLENIIKKSKANVNIEDSVDDANCKKVTISGSYHIVMRAQAWMVAEILRKNKQFNPLKTQQISQQQDQLD